MSKMSAPEMDVIRFNESDVIVASVGAAEKTLSISGVGDGQGNTAFLNIGGTDYTSRHVIDSDSDFIAAYNTYMSGLTTYSSSTLLHRGQESLSIGTVLKDDADAGSSDIYYHWPNTTYTWNDGWYAQ